MKIATDCARSRSTTLQESETYIRVEFTEAIRTKTVQNMSTAMRPSRKLRLVFNLLCDLFVFNMKMQ